MGLKINKYNDGDSDYYEVRRDDEYETVLAWGMVMGSDVRIRIANIVSGLDENEAEDVAMALTLLSTHLSNIVRCASQLSLLD